MIVLILAALIALVARVDAAGAADEDAIDLAIRYADALTGIASDPARAPTLDAFDEDDDDDGVDDDDDADDDDDDGASATLRAGRAEKDLDEDEAGRDETVASGDTEARGAADIDGDRDAAVGDAGGATPAMLDAELDPGDAMVGADAVYAAAPAGAAELYEQSLRHQRPSRWGRLDVGVSLRRRWSEPMHAPASRRDEVWLVATWRR